MSQNVVVYHSGHGHTERMARCVAEGARGRLLAIDAQGNLPDGGWDVLATADSIILGSPTYMGNVSWQFKKFADASSKPWAGQQWRGKVFAGFTNSATMNGDKHSTLQYMSTLAMQHGGIWVGTGMLPSNSKAAQRNDVNFVGSFSGAMAQTPSDAGVDEMWPGDLETARLFGHRVAATTDEVVASRGLRARHAGVERDNLSIATRFVEQGLGRADLSVFDECLDANISVVTALSPGGPIQGLEAYKAVFAGFADAWPVTSLVIHDSFASGDRVVVNFTATAVFRKDYYGVKANGVVAPLIETHVYTLRAGKIVANSVGAINLPFEFTMYPALKEAVLAPLSRES